MKKLSMLLILILMLTGCAPNAQPTEQSLLPNDDNGAPTQVPVDLTPAQRAALSALSSTLNLPVDQITLTSTEAVTWPDGCLGVQRVGVMCTQALVEGFKIILEADGKQYEFHTNQDGTSVAQAVLSSGSSSVEDAVRNQLALNLGMDVSEISVVSDSTVEFADSCLGVAMQDVICAQTITPGHIIVLESGGIQYEYHTDEDGSVIQPATLALVWRREGGIAGFCDSLTIFLSGEVYGSQCKSQPNGTMGTFASLLSPDERKLFDRWAIEFGQVNLDASDPKGVSDRMEVTIEFFGNGKGSLTSADEQALLLWVQGVFQKLNS